MPLRLLTDEQIAPRVAEQARTKRPDADSVGLAEWHRGAFLGQADDALLRVAAREGRTLVTYDRRTISPILQSWGAAGEHHAGVVFVDHERIPQSAIGGLVMALVGLWDLAREWDWTDAVATLLPARRSP